MSVVDQRHGKVWHAERSSMVRCGAVWYGMVRCGMKWYGVVWYGMVWYGMVWYGMAWYGTVWHGYDMGTFAVEKEHVG